MLFAIGLLTPQPRLIAILLWHQRKLPYWCTLVWNSHQLIPNKAYSPQGRLLRKRRDSVFRCGYDCTPLHPRPPLGGETRTSRYKPSSYYRLSSVSCTLGARRQDWVLGTMGFALHRDANFSRFKLILVEIATTRLIQRRVISYRLLKKVKILGETSVKETVLQQTLLPAALSFSLIGLSHEPGALGIIIYPLREVYASLNLTHILYYKFSKKSKNKGLGFAWRTIQKELAPSRRYHP